MRKAFGLSFIKQVFLVLGCLYGAQFFTGVFAAIDCGPPPVAVGPMGGVASSDVDSTDVNAAKQYDTCMVKWNLVYLLYIPLTLVFLVYAGFRRHQMRLRFGIPGDEWEECARAATPARAAAAASSRTRYSPAQLLLLVLLRALHALPGDAHAVRQRRGGRLVACAHGQRPRGEAAAHRRHHAAAPAKAERVTRHRHSSRARARGRVR
jgi:hypothetical protein